MSGVREAGWAQVVGLVVWASLAIGCGGEDGTNGGSRDSGPDGGRTDGAADAAGDGAIDAAREGGLKF